MAAARERNSGSLRITVRSLGREMAHGRSDERWGCAYPTWKAVSQRDVSTLLRIRFALQQCVTRCRRSIARTPGFPPGSASPYTLASIRRTSIVDFNDTPAEAASRKEVRSFLDAHAPARTDPTQSAFSEGREDGEAVKVAKAWQSTLFDAGWACLSWPKEFGGRGAAPIERVIWSQEVSPLLDAPTDSSLIGQGMCGPTLMAYADRGAKAPLPAGAWRAATTSGVNCSVSR